MSGDVPDLGGAVLGIDVGSVRVGIAASDPSRTVATPLETLPRAYPDQLWSRLQQEIVGRHVALVVVGLPRRLDGTEGDAANDAHGFAEELAHRTGVEVVLWDERFTTAQARRGLIAAGLKRNERRAVIDTVAATLMLQSWLDSRRARAARG